MSRITGDEGYMVDNDDCVSGCGRLWSFGKAIYRCCEECLPNHGLAHTKECNKANPQRALADAVADMKVELVDALRLEDLMAGMVLASRSVKPPHILGERANHIQSVGVTIYYGMLVGLVFGWGWLMLELIWLISGQDKVPL